VNIPGWIWAATIALYALLFVVDLLVVGRRPHIPSTAECVRWLGLYVGIAVAFGLAMWWWAGRDYAIQFFAGWVTEYSLSVDNLFVFLLIMARFFVPRELQQSVLMYGIFIALILRALFIVLGAAVIAQYSWIFYFFGVFLVFTAVKLATEGETDDDEYRENALVRWVSRLVSTTPEFHGTKLHTVVEGQKLWTPMLLVLLSLGTTDLVFALDSIPAIFGLTQEAYIVFAANVFALLGLRQLYFLLGDLLNRLVYLSIGLAIVLGFIGVKLVLEAMHTNSVTFLNGGEPFEVPVPSTGLSLAVIVTVLTITTVASLVASRREGTAESR
jgi:tellurite resistance protein TerC